LTYNCPSEDSSQSSRFKDAAKALNIEKTEEEFRSLLLRLANRDVQDLKPGDDKLREEDAGHDQD
jgi:hypothetical protein